VRGPLTRGDGRGVVVEPVVTGAADSVAGASGRTGVADPLAGAPLVALHNPPGASPVVMCCPREARFGSREGEPSSPREPGPSADREPMPTPDGDTTATLGAVVAAPVRAAAAPADTPHSNVVAIPIAP
jgi:hypothetical protein